MKNFHLSIIIECFDWMVKSNYYKIDIIDFKFYLINQNYNY